MNVQEKSLKLAELMGWTIQDCAFGKMIKVFNEQGGFHRIDLCPYDDKEFGMGSAQFAAILLKFPEVMDQANNYGFADGMLICCSKHESYYEPTQANILDEILRMNGVEL